jgi:hypothetical protein
LAEGLLSPAHEEKSVQLKPITYTSLARLHFTEGDLSDIHQTARHLNALDGATGLLLFDGRRFMQIIKRAAPSNCRPPEPR